jgi:hypothetical protein
MNDLQDNIIKFALIFSCIVVWGLGMGLVKGQYSIDFESILGFLKPFLSPAYSYHFLIEVMSRDYFINDHLFLEKTYYSLAIVTIIYSALILTLVFLLGMPLRLFKLTEKYSSINSIASSIFALLIIPAGISFAFLCAIIPSIVIFSIAPTLIKGFFNG